MHLIPIITKKERIRYYKRQIMMAGSSASPRISVLSSSLNKYETILSIDDSFIVFRVPGKRKKRLDGWEMTGATRASGSWCSITGKRDRG